MAGEPEVKTIIVVPCYNEAERIDVAGFVEMLSSWRMQFLFVDDGSTDDTVTELRSLIAENDEHDVLRLPRNVGKGEAVRQGLLAAVDRGAGIVGYFDADLATPSSELVRLVTIAHANKDLEVVMGSRISRLGSRIERRAARHYLGRIYASVAALALGVDVYDTQCGAKLFRTNATFREAIRAPFRSSWAFDVELLQRLLYGSGGLPGLGVDAFLEEPLEMWREVEGSKLRVGGSLAALARVVALGIRRHRLVGPGPGRRSKKVSSSS